MEPVSVFFYTTPRLSLNVFERLWFFLHGLVSPFRFSPPPFPMQPVSPPPKKKPNPWFVFLLFFWAKKSFSFFFPLPPLLHSLTLDSGLLRPNGDFLTVYDPFDRSPRPSFAFLLLRPNRPLPCWVSPVRPNAVRFFWHHGRRDTNRFSLLCLIFPLFFGISAFLTPFKRNNTPFQPPQLESFYLES